MKIMLKAFLIFGLILQNSFIKSSQATDLEQELTKKTLIISAVTIHNPIPELIAELLDPVSLHCVMSVSHAWNQNLKDSPFLFLSQNEAERNGAFATECFSNLFRKACNTPGGLMILAGYTGFYPSHFKSVYPFNGLESDIYQNILQAAIPSKFKGDDLFLSDEMLGAMELEDQKNLLDEIVAGLPCLKLLAVTDPEHFQKHVDLMKLPQVICRLSQDVDQYATSNLWYAYVNSMTEDFNPFRWLLDVDEHEGFLLTAEHKILFPVFAFCFEKLKTDQSVTPEQLIDVCYDFMDALWLETKKEEQPAFLIQQNLRRSVAETFKDLLPKSNTVLQQLEITSTLQYKFDEPCSFEELALQAANQGIYTYDSINFLIQTAHPKTEKAVFEYTAECLENIRSRQSYLYSDPALSVLINSNEHNNITLATDLVMELFQIGSDYPDVGNLDSCTPLKVIMKTDVEKAQQFLNKYIDCFREPFNAEKLIWGARHRAKLFKDTQGAQAILDMVFEHSSELTPKNWLSLVINYQLINEPEKAAQCLMNAEKVINLDDFNLMEELAYAYALLGKKECAQKLFSMTVPYKMENMKEGASLWPILKRLGALDDLTFLKSIGAPFIEVRQLITPKSLKRETLNFYFAQKVGLVDCSDFFYNRFCERRAYLSSLVARQRLASYFKMQPEDILTISKDELSKKWSLKFAVKGLQEK